MVVCKSYWRIELGICPTMVQAMSQDPPLDATLKSETADETEEAFEGSGGLERFMGPESVIADGDTEGGELPWEDGQEECLPWYLVNWRDVYCPINPDQMDWNKLVGPDPKGGWFPRVCDWLIEMDTKRVGQLLF